MFYGVRLRLLLGFYILASYFPGVSHLKYCIIWNMVYHHDVMRGIIYIVCSLHLFFALCMCSFPINNVHGVSKMGIVKCFQPWHSIHPPLVTMYNCELWKMVLFAILLKSRLYVKYLSCVNSTIISKCHLIYLHYVTRADLNEQNLRKILEH